MVNDHLAAPVFEITKNSQPVSLVETPYLYLDGMTPRYLATPPPEAKVIEAAQTDPNQAIGAEHVVPEIEAVTPNGQYGMETQLALVAQEVTYEPLWATRTIAAAFGATLVKPGEAIRIEGPSTGIAVNEYEYGVFAGHWSPYQNTGDRLLSRVITDLEHHDFPHVFASTDPAMPLVISVGRYWPRRGVIRLADLWVEQGSALYIPPKPHIPGAEVVDLHNNRNSARACWGDLERSTIDTHTLLQPENGYFYWFWNALDTHHSRPIEGTRP